MREDSTVSSVVDSSLFLSSRRLLSSAMLPCHDVDDYDAVTEAAPVGRGRHEWTEAEATMVPNKVMNNLMLLLLVSSRFHKVESSYGNTSRRLLSLAMLPCHDVDDYDVAIAGEAATTAEAATVPNKVMSNLMLLLFSCLFFAKPKIS